MEGGALPAAHWPVTAATHSVTAAAASVTVAVATTSVIVHGGQARMVEHLVIDDGTELVEPI